MNDHAFARAINQIAAEAEQQKLAEAKAEQRRLTLARVRKVCLTLVGAALVVYAYTHRGEFGQQIQKLTQSQTPAAESELAKNLQDVRASAAKRDNALEAIERK